MSGFVHFMIWFVVIVGAFIAYGLYSSTPKAVAARQEAAERQAKIVCPHCQTAGEVTTRRVTRKRGVSGGKATGAVLTGGVSMLATGLSRKQQVTNMVCASCGMTWDVA